MSWMWPSVSAALAGEISGRLVYHPLGHRSRDWSDWCGFIWLWLSHISWTIITSQHILFQVRVRSAYHETQSSKYLTHSDFVMRTCSGEWQRLATIPASIWMARTQAQVIYNHVAERLSDVWWGGWRHPVDSWIDARSNYAHCQIAVRTRGQFLGNRLNHW